MEQDRSTTGVGRALAVRRARAERLEKLWSGLGAGSDAVRLCAAASAITDLAATECWLISDMPEGCALVAVGGYGRGALWPGSDVDAMVLAPDSVECPEPQLEEALSRLAANMWDAGLDPGLVARRVGECAALALEDVTIRSAMMERRLVAGCAARMDEIRGELDALDPLPFYLAKMREQRERHARHGDSPFGLEPNLKEAPGGLRDMQMPMWVARAMGIEPTWDGLKSAGLLTGGEAELASACEARLSLLRAMLHRHAPRAGERLDFESQAKLAGELGIGAEGGRSAAATMMDGFFACARSAVMINEVLLQGMSERLLDLESGPVRVLSERFHERGGLLWASSAEVFAKEPSALFEAFEWMQREESLAGMGSRTTRALWRAGRRVDSWFRADARNREAFVRMLSAPRGVVGEINRMARVGLLGAYIPAFGKAETLMQHDLFHAYTVGRHTLGAVRNLRRFLRQDRAHELPALSGLALGFDRYWLLYVGALFHDIAKGRGGRHEEKGERDAIEFCSQHGIEGEDRELVAFLVLRHLEMSRVSQKLDIQDPEVVEEFAKMCGTQRRLNALYLLTVADMRATGPTVWNDWKGRLLESLWTQCRAALSGGLPAGGGKASAMRAAALGAAMEAGASLAQAQSHVDSLDDLYFLKTSESECAWHAKALAMVDRGASACRVESHEGRVRVVVWTADQQGLFAKICSALARAGISVASAKLASQRSGWALDSFDGEDLRGEDPGPARRSRIEAMVLEAIAPGAARHGPALGRCSARARHAGAVAQAQVDQAGSDYLVEVACADRSGVLWTIADEFERRGIEVKSARVTTVGERAEDVFVVAGDALGSPEARLALESALVDRLGA